MALDGEPTARTNSYMVEKSQVCLSPSRKWSWLMHMGVYTEGRYLELDPEASLFLMLIWHTELRILATSSDNTYR